MPTTPAPTPTATTPTTPLVMPGTVPAAPPGQMTRPPRAPKPADKFGWWWGTGRRKTAIARIRMKPAEGEKATVSIEAPNGKVKTVDVYFCEERDRNDAIAPLKINGLLGRVRVIAKVHGGGFMGQAGAIKLAIARAVRDYDPTFEDALRDANMLTRDAREVERKKYGQAGARRRFQFSKR
jgi:small subunit ribosomal protein S9